MHASASITLINKICFCSNVWAGGKQNLFHINKQACKYSYSNTIPLFIIASLHLPPAHTDKELKLQHKHDVIYELDAALWVDALRSYLTFLQRAGLVSFKRRAKPYKVLPLEIHTPTELQEKRRNETETRFIRS